MITINNKKHPLQPGTTLQQIAAQHELPEKGVAIAVNNEMVPRSEWATHLVEDNDDILIVKAFCGG
jgi:sulfur carrier protein